jgi:FAD/FMN-containing dehydrogenase
MNIDELVTLIGKDSISTATEDLITYGKDWIKDFKPNPLAIVFPKSTEEVRKVVQWANANNAKLVPSGGRTGLSGGATALHKEIVISLSKMNKVLELNPNSRLLKAEAGCPTEKLQIIARENGFYFPVDFASKGSSQLGGNIATNAGGIRVVKYGGFRDWIVHLTVVTGAGEILSLGGELFKNQTGYDLRQLFIGSEGTLGIITEATIQLTSAPDDITRAFAGVPSLDAAIQLFTQSRDAFSTLSAFELLSNSSLQKVLKHHPAKRFPLTSQSPWYVVIEFESFDGAPSRESLEEFLSSQMEDELVTDCTISESIAAANELMSLRESISETLTSHYVVHKNDISVPLTKIPEAISRISDKVKELYHHCTAEIFGHIGDGNLHINICKSQGTPQENEKFYEDAHTNDQHIFTIIKELKGSISAEHGVGLLKKPFLHFTRSEAEIALMRGIKKVFDPNEILNPGKIF